MRRLDQTAGEISVFRQHSLVERKRLLVKISVKISVHAEPFKEAYSCRYVQVCASSDWSYAVCKSRASLVAQRVKRLPAMWEDLGLIPGSGRASEEGNGSPLQCPCPENPKDGGAQ